MYRCVISLAAFLCATTIPAATPQYTITTVAGSGDDGFAGDGGDARCARLNRPSGVDVSSDGSILIADYNNNRIRRVAVDGTISTVAGNGARGFAGDGGAAKDAQLAGPYGVRVVDDGFLVADALNGRIRHVNQKGVIRTVASGFEHPVDVVRGPDGKLYVAEGGGNRVRRIESDGSLTVIAGSGKRRYTGEGGYSGDGGRAVDAQLNVPGALAFDRDGNLFIADLRNHVVRRVDTAGVITTVAGNGAAGAAGDGGPATRAELNQPGGLAWEGGGSLLISEIPRIRRLTRDGRLETVAGSATRGFYGDHGDAKQALLSVLDLIAVDAGGNVYIADYGNHRIRKLIPRREESSRPVRPAATKDVEDLLAKMRYAYQKIEAATLSFRVSGERPLTGVIDYKRAATIDARLDVEGFGAVNVGSDGTSIRVLEPGAAPYEHPFALDRLRRAVVANLEVISLWDSERQLKTSDGGNMAGPDLSIAAPLTWNGRDWIILDEKAGPGVYRYFIDPRTFLIWRTVATGAGGAVFYDGRVEKLNWR